MAAMPPTPEQPEVRLVASARRRARARVDPVPWPEADDPSIDALVDRLSELPTPWAVTLSGGEPTLRPDLPGLLRALSAAEAPRLSLATDGLALTSDRAVSALADAGLTRVRIGLHSARADAHDWLAGAPGAARRVRRALETCAKAGLAVAIDTVVTRPVMPLLEEVVLLVSALGAREIHFHRPVFDPHHDADAVALSPRFGLLQPYLEAAAAAGRRRGMQVGLHGFPHCAAPARTDLHLPPGAERWVFPTDAAWDAARSAVDPSFSRGCPDCPPGCPGAPVDYVALFGRTEFDSQDSAGEPGDIDEGGRVPVPAPRAGWTPATRVIAARQRARRGPPAKPPGQPVERLTLDLDPTSSTREARLILVKASQQRPRVLRLRDGWLAHPKAAGLLAETKYFDPEVEVVGEVDRLARLPSRKLTRLGKLARVDAVLRGPDAATHDERVGRPGAFEATLALLPRLETAGIAARLCADPADDDEQIAFEDAWATGGLPGEPAWLRQE